MNKEKAIFAAGCFWGVEKLFYYLSGVTETRVGYTGGKTENPSYEQVSSVSTGHAEAVEIIFDTDIISYKEILDNFWQMHDPTTLNQQGPDVGSQYRSAIFYLNEKQKKEAEESKEKQEKDIGKKIVTEITPSQNFYEAEKYHQKYFLKNPGEGCHI